MIYLFSAYAVIWLALFAYLFLIDRKAGRLLSEMDSLAGQSDKDT